MEDEEEENDVQLGMSLWDCIRELGYAAMLSYGLYEIIQWLK